MTEGADAWESLISARSQLGIVRPSFVPFGKEK